MKDSFSYCEARRDGIALKFWSEVCSVAPLVGAKFVEFAVSRGVQPFENFVSAVNPFELRLNLFFRRRRKPPMDMYIMELRHAEVQIRN